MPDPFEMANDPDRVADDELLYRSIWLEERCFFFDEQGQLRVSAEAFADRNREPSVFRKQLCEEPPFSSPPRLNPDDAVVAFIAGRIREKASPIAHQSGKQPEVLHVIDVRPDTSNNQHPSHAVVFANPQFPNANAFAKLKLRLAQLIDEWAIRPNEAFVQELKRSRG